MPKRPLLAAYAVFGLLSAAACVAGAQTPDPLDGESAERGNQPETRSPWYWDDQPDRRGVEAFTQPYDLLELRFTVAGRVSKRHVDAGDRVEAGDVLLELRDEEGEAMIDLWQMRAEDQVPIRQAEASLEMAQWQLAQAEQLEAGDAVSKLELKRARIQVRIEESALEAAHRDQRMAQKELGRYQAAHRQYVMKAPRDAMVEEVQLSEGESADPDNAALYLSVTDPLLVDAPTPIAQTLSLKVADKAWVRMLTPGSEKVIEGEIVHMRSVADAASGTRIVRVEIDNAAGFPAGMPVVVTYEAPGVARSNKPARVASGNEQNGE